MKYDKRVILKNGREVRLRNADAADGNAVLEIFNLTHAETDFLLSYPDENSFTAEKEAEFLRQKAESPNEIEIIAVIDGRVVGAAGVESEGNKFKIRHRADFGISILKDYWGLGIGKALTEACIQCAKDAGYEQLELTAVADNAAAINLYKKVGFVEFGRNPKGFKSRTSGYQEIVYMRLEL